MENINKAVHEAMGECFHEAVRGGEVLCLNCGDEVYATDYKNEKNPELNGIYVAENRMMPDYCSDLNAVALAEKFAIDKVGEERYWHALRRFVPAYPVARPVELITAKAEYRALAVLEALGIDGHETNT